MGPNVGCTITIHHLQLLVDDWAGCSHHFCKPVAKFPHDRDALRRVIQQGDPKFFLGTDSAPHPKHLKEKTIVSIGTGVSHAPAGVFVTPLVLPYLATILDSFGALDKLEGFACQFGRRFYGIPTPIQPKLITLVKSPCMVPLSYDYTDDDGQERHIVPFMAGKQLTWSFKE